MADPAFQLIPSLAASGWYGSDYGGSPYGGSAPLPYTFRLHHPSDDLAGNGRPIIGEVRHKRLGIIVGGRRWARARVWRVAQRAINQEALDAFAVFHDSRKFLVHYLGYGGPTNTVWWIDDQFTYTRLRGGYYNLDFEIQEA